MTAPIFLFDGVCNFCNASVQFIIAHDARGVMQFAPLQSALGQELVKKHGITSDSAVFVDGDRAYEKSSGAVRVARHFAWPYKLLAALWIVPKPLRDLGYSIFAALRYRLFGKRDACMVPTPETRARFLSMDASAA